jgi:AbrB family looped-hinge helix DNA binding protein
METTKLSTNGRMTIPKRLRGLYGWEAGLAFAIIDTGQVVLLKPVRPFPVTTVDEVAGSLVFDGNRSE